MSGHARSADRDEPAVPLLRAADADERPTVYSAKKDGRHVATFRRFDRGDDSIVECDIYPVNSMRVEPVRPGPYVFPSREVAKAFLEETGRALEYLGCEFK